MARIDAEVIEEENDDGYNNIIVRVDGDNGKDKLSFVTYMDTIVGSQSDSAELKLIYESMRAIHGYYRGDDGDEYESNLWYDGRPTNSFEEFDFFDNWGSPEAKSDTILWRRDEADDGEQTK